MIKVGKYVFYCYHICFHFVRDNIYSPWETIGIVTTNPINYDSYYLKEYNHYRQAFFDEFGSIENQNVAASYEAIDNYRKRYQKPFDVMGPPIKYYTSQPYVNEHGNTIARHMYGLYIGDSSINAFKMLLLMHQLKDGYFATLMNCQNWDREDMAKELVAAGYMA